MDILKPYREKIDSLDDAIVDLLAERMSVVREVAALKTREGIPAILPDRVEVVRGRCVDRAAKAGMDPDIVRTLYTLLIEHCCHVEDEFIRKNRRRSA